MEPSPFEPATLRYEKKREKEKESDSYIYNSISSQSAQTIYTA